MPLSRASVVIPAHNEALVIGGLLRTLADEIRSGTLETVVVCNGCTDETAAVAGSFAGVKVVEVDTPSKVVALNIGDASVTTFPRLYLDADIAIEVEDLYAVVAALEGHASAAAPVPQVDVAGCHLGSRLYFAVFSRLGYARRHVLGSGCYGLSAEGRARFQRFPDLVADDGFVYGLFGPDERHNPVGATFTIRAPHDLRSIYRRRVRIAVGNLQLQRAGSRRSAPGPSWKGVLFRRPWLAPAVLLYLTINGLAQVRAERLLRAGSTGGWNRDRTAREAHAAEARVR